MHFKAEYITASVPSLKAPLMCDFFMRRIQRLDGSRPNISQNVLHFKMAFPNVLGTTALRENRVTLLTWLFSKAFKTN